MPFTPNQKGHNGETAEGPVPARQSLLDEGLPARSAHLPEHRHQQLDRGEAYPGRAPRCSPARGVSPTASGQGALGRSAGRPDRVLRGHGQARCGRSEESRGPLGAVLRRVAHQNKKLAGQPPRFEKLQEDNIRQGFFEREQFEAVRKHLPAYARPVVTFMYLTGWRIRSEVLPLPWRQVDFQAGTVRLEPGTTKNKDGRTFYLTPELRTCLEAQRAATEALQRQTGRIIPWVFHREGTPMKSFWKAWKTACKAAGTPGRIPHDFRRTAVRNLERAGVPRSVAMKMAGHKTEAIYRRYAIVSDADLQDAAKKLAAVSASGDNLVTVAPARP